jgi:hypothetical protein
MALTEEQVKKLIAETIITVQEIERNRFSSWIAEGCAECFTLTGFAKFLRLKLCELKPNDEPDDKSN